MNEKVRDFRRRLETIGQGASQSDETLIEFLRILADLDDMSIEAFFKRMIGRTKTAVPAKVPFDQKASLAKLRRAMSDDDAFHDEIETLKAQRGATKPVLTSMFYSLFDRTQGVPSKATRAELLRLIEDERNILVRNSKMGEMLGRRVVPAE